MLNTTLIILGSARSDGNTRKMVDFLLQHVSADWIDLNEYSFSDYDYKYQNAEDDFIELADKMVKYENIVFATPVYWYAMSAVMKRFFDRFSDIVGPRKAVGRRLAGKHLFALACSSDSMEYDGFFMPFKMTAEYLDMNFGGDVHTWVEDDELPEEVKRRLLDFSKMF